MAWTADDLVAAVRRRAQLPDAAADGAVSDADIVALANEELSLHLVPLVRASREDYWTTSEDVAIVSGTASYRVPWRAQASGLRDVCLVDSAGNERPLVRVSPTEIGRIQAYSGGIERIVFVMEGPSVRLVPTPTVSGYTLRMRYHRAHSTLVPNSLAADFLGLSSTNVSTSTALPSGWSSLFTGDGTYVTGYLDIIHARPPFGPVAVSAPITNVTGTEFITWSDLVAAGVTASTVPGSVYFALEGETPIVDLPRECWPLLVSAVTARTLEVTGDRDGAQMAIALYQRERENVAQLLEPRVEGAKVKVIDRNSPLRRGGRRWF